jgi:hypothetical protein
MKLNKYDVFGCLVMLFICLVCGVTIGIVFGLFTHGVSSDSSLGIFGDSKVKGVAVIGFFVPIIILSMKRKSKNIN